MTAFIVIDYGSGDRPQQAVLTADGWQVRGHPESTLPALLDRKTDYVAESLSTADPAPYEVVARHIASFLGGRVRWARKLRTKPGSVN